MRPADLARTLRLPVVSALNDAHRTVEFASPTGRARLGAPPQRHWLDAGLGSPAWRTGALTYAVAQAVLLCWWIAFYPATLNYDSVLSVWQVSTSNWTTQSSVAYNALVWLSLQATGELSPLTLAQTAALAVGLGHAVTGLSRLRVPYRLVGVAAVAAICLPVLGTFTMYVSKDVPFAIVQVWLLGTVARILASRTHTDRRPWLVLFTELVVIGLFRLERLRPDRAGHRRPGHRPGRIALAAAGLRHRSDHRGDGRQPRVPDAGQSAR